MNKNFLEELYYSELKNKRKRNLIYLISFSITIFLIFLIYFFYNKFYSNIFWNKFIYKGIENSFLYSNVKKAEQIKDREIAKFFTYSFTIKEKDLLDKEQWNLFLETVPFNFKFKNRDCYQIYGFLNKNELDKQINELLKEEIIKNFTLHEPKINKELLK